MRAKWQKLGWKSNFSTSRMTSTPLSCAALTAFVRIHLAEPSGAVGILPAVSRIDRDAVVLDGTRLLVTRGAVGKGTGHPRSWIGWPKTPRTGPTNTLQIEEAK